MARRITLDPGARPEPRGPGRNPWLLFYAVMGAPLAWSAQLVIDAAIAAYPCAPTSTIFVAAPISSGLDRAILFVFNVLAILAGLVAAWLALEAWRGAENTGVPAPAALMAERLNRTRYLALWGLMNGALFVAALIFDTVMLIGTPPQC